MPERHGKVSVEATDIHPRKVYAAAGLLIVLIVAAALAAWGLLGLHRLAPQATGPAAPRDFPLPSPRLQEAPQADRGRYFAEKERLLHRLEWLDRRKGAVRIPIEDAMALLARRGRAAPDREGAGP
jgi:hypothetical protein